MSYFYRRNQMQEVSKAFQSERTWDESKVTRGKTSPESNDGSFAPSGGAPSVSEVARDALAEDVGGSARSAGAVKPSKEMDDYYRTMVDRGDLPASVLQVGGGVKVLEAPREQSMPGGKYDPNYVNQENWTLSNKQPAPAEMRQHGREMGQAVRDVSDAASGSAGRLAELQQRLAGEYGADYARQVTQRAADEMRSPAEAARTKALDDAADRQASMSYKSPGKITLGAILSRSWGYDQTNVDFYEVTGMSPSGKTATLREVAKIKDYKGDMTGKVRAVPGKYTSGPKARRISPKGGIKVDSGYASLWQGEDKFFSEYA